MRTLLYDNQSTVHTQLFAPLACCRVLHVCVLFEGLDEFCFVCRFVFLCHFAGFHVANRAVTLLLLLHRCMKSFSAFCSEYSRARPSTACMSQFSRRAMFTRPISCARSTVTVAATARPICRMLCTGAWLTIDKLSVVSYDPLTHSRHNAGGTGCRSAKVGYKIRWINIGFSDLYYGKRTFILASSLYAKDCSVRPVTL